MTCFWRHRWARWIDLGVYKIIDVTTTASREALLQERRCERCNRCERRYVDGWLHV